MGKWSQGEFEPKNPEKYIGTYPIKYRSSWELMIMNKCDDHPSILYWSSESVQIPYRHPIKNRQSLYIPDFLVVFVDKHGKQRSELWEIKPYKETVLEAAKSKRDKAMVAINQYKWKAAQEWCKRNKVTFRVLTEKDLYR